MLKRLCKKKRAEQPTQTQRYKERKAREDMERTVQIDDNLTFRDLELYVHDGGRTITLEELGLRLKGDDEEEVEIKLFGVRIKVTRPISDLDI